MSMTTEFVEKLRKDATALYDSEVLINQRIESQCVKDMREAADMIEELSLKLHNSQMERSSQFYQCRNEMLRLQAEMDTLNSIKTELEMIVVDYEKENENG